MKDLARPPRSFCFSIKLSRVGMSTRQSHPDWLQLDSAPSPSTSVRETSRYCGSVGVFPGRIFDRPAEGPACRRKADDAGVHHLHGRGRRSKRGQFHCGRHGGKQENPIRTYFWHTWFIDASFGSQPKGRSRQLACGDRFFGALVAFNPGQLARSKQRWSHRVIGDGGTATRGRGAAGSAD